MFKKKIIDTKDKQFREYQNKAKEWDNDIYLNAARSQRTAWIIAGIAAAIAIVQAFAIASLAPMKEKVPYILRVDNSTGIVDKMVTLYDDKEIRANEELKRYFIKKYLDARLGYEYKFAKEYYNTAFYMSEYSVAVNLKKAYEKDNPVHKYRDKTKIDIQIKSFELLPDNEAYIRLVETNQTVGEQTVKTHYVVRIGYDYLSGKIPQSIRDINPLGFVVTNFVKTKEEL